MSDIPPPPPGFTVEEDKPNRRKRGQHKADAIAPPSVDGDIIVRPIDGDTLKLTSGRDLRLWGVDTPERRQQGWDRQGNAVAIGREVTGTLRDLIGSGQPTLGNSVGTSYGRLVAPVTVNDMNAGLSMIRDGQALSAPSYLSADPTRRYDYVQAERLARQNFRGMHQTYNQRPEQFRQNPDYQPSRDELAQFWDIPTPNAGLTAHCLEQNVTGRIAAPRGTEAVLSSWFGDDGWAGGSPRPRRRKCRRAWSWWPSGQ